jgi:hypothetical protein
MQQVVVSYSEVYLDNRSVEHHEAKLDSNPVAAEPEAAQCSKDKYAVLT